jgi:hypothetical protein
MQFWHNGSHSTPQVTWNDGDSLEFKVDFAKNVTSFHKNGQLIHEYSFNPSVATLYPCVTGGSDCHIQVTFPQYVQPLPLVAAHQVAAPTIDEVKGVLVRVGECWYTRSSVLKIQDISRFHYLLGRRCDIFESRLKIPDVQSNSSVDCKPSQSNASLLSKFKSAAVAVQLAAKVNIFSRHSFSDRFLLFSYDFAVRNFQN